MVCQTGKYLEPSSAIIQAMSLTRKVAVNSTVQMSGRLIATLISFVTVKLLTTRLGPSGYGEYAAILNYVAFFGTLADFGFYWIMVKELATIGEDRKRSDYVISNILAFRSVFALIVLACAAITVYLIPAGTIAILTPTVKLGIVVVALATFWQSLNMTFVGIFQSHYRMDKPVSAEIIGRIVSLALLLPFLSLHLNVAWLVSAMVWGAIVNFLVNMYFARPYASIGMNWDFKYWRSIFGESAMLGIVSVLALVYFKIDGLILSIVKTSTEVGIYAAPYKIIEIINFFPSIFMGLVFTALIQHWKVDREKAAGLVHRATEAMIVLAFPVLAGGIVLAKPLMEFISSKGYAQASTYTANFGGHSVAISGIIILQLLLVAVTADFFGNIFGKGIIAFGSTKLLLWPNIIAVLFNIGANLYLIPRWSYFGAALTTIITEFLVLIIQILIIRRFIKLQVPWNTLWRTLLAVAIMVLVLLPLRSHNALIGIIVGTAVYALAVWKFGAVSKETLQTMLKRAS